MVHRVRVRMAYALHESQISSFSALQFIEVELAPLEGTDVFTNQNSLIYPLRSLLFET